MCPKLASLIGIVVGALLNGCATRASPLLVDVARAGEGCAIEVAGRRFGYGESDFEQMRTLVSSWPNRRAILNMVSDAPYRCVGGVIYTLQRARFERIDLEADGRPFPLPISN
jgi:hypothetical protein